MSLKLLLKYIVSLILGLFLGNLLYKFSNPELIVVNDNDN